MPQYILCRRTIANMSNPAPVADFGVSVDKNHELLRLHMAGYPQADRGWGPFSGIDGPGKEGVPTPAPLLDSALAREKFLVVT